MLLPVHDARIARPASAAKCSRARRELAGRSHGEIDAARVLFIESIPLNPNSEMEIR